MVRASAGKKLRESQKHKGDCRHCHDAEGVEDSTTRCKASGEDAADSGFAVICRVIRAQQDDSSREAASAVIRIRSARVKAESERAKQGTAAWDEHRTEAETSDRHAEGVRCVEITGVMSTG